MVKKNENKILIVDELEVYPLRKQHRQSWNNILAFRGLHLVIRFEYRWNRLKKKTNLNDNKISA